MLARVAIASDALDGGTLPVAVRNSVQHLLAERLAAHGRLVFSNEPELLDLVRAIKDGPGLSQEARKRWVETVIHMRTHERISVGRPPTDGDLASIHTLAGLRDRCRSGVDVAVIGTSQSIEVGVPEETGFLVDDRDQLEIATAVGAPHSPRLANFQASTEASFLPHGSEREQFWTDVLGPMALGSRSAVVLDGYLFESLIALEEGRPWTRGWRTEHVVWLLEHLDLTMASGAHVELLTTRKAKGTAYSAAELCRQVQARWSPAPDGNISKVTVAVCRPKKGQKFPHDRHVRFSTGVAVELFAGFDRLREEHVWDEDGMKWLYRWRPSAVGALKAMEQRSRGLDPEVDQFSPHAERKA
jgi:hypothetical protein